MSWLTRLPLVAKVLMARMSLVNEVQASVVGLEVMQALYVAISVPSKSPG